MKVMINAFIHAVHRNEYNAETSSFIPAVGWELYPFDMSVSSDGRRVLVGQQAVEVEVPDDFDIRAGLVDNLEREKRRIAAEYQKRVTELNSQIRNLLALEAS
jgi:hypothetical protein